MDDNSVIALLESITDPPEPVSRVDIEAARRRGRRRQRLWQVGAPVLAVVAVTTAVTVPRLAFPGHAERAAASGIPTVSAPRAVRHPAMPSSAPAKFNVLVPYAAFGWLPAGYSEASIPLSLGGLDNSGPTELDRAALSADGSMLSLGVYARGACTAVSHPKPALGSAAPATQAACFSAAGTAPDINGRRAVWLDGGWGVAWEYAPNAWADVYASGGSATRGAGHASPATDGKRGRPALPPATSATRNLLLKVAGAVKYGQRIPLHFSVRLTSPLPAGWQLQETGFHDVNGRLLADGLAAGPAADTSALAISASAQFYACKYVDGQSSYVTRDGVNWEYRVLDDHIAKNVEMLCSTAKVDGLQVNIYLDMAPEQAGAPPLPGSTELGGAFGVYEKLVLLGTNPANWTTHPLP
jgi:hypothetical protein